MTLAVMLCRMGACHDATTWLRANRRLSDSALWYAVEEPTWLLFVLERADSVDKATLARVSAPLMRNWRVAKVVLLDQFQDAYSELDEYDWSGQGRLRAAYGADLLIAAQNCCAMMRATFAIPTRQQLMDAFMVWSEPELLPF